MGNNCITKKRRTAQHGARKVCLHLGWRVLEDLDWLLSSWDALYATKGASAVSLPLALWKCTNRVFWSSILDGAHINTKDSSHQSFMPVRE